MIKAVIFDMYETLITHYNTPLYFGAQMAKDAGISLERFQGLWRATEEKRTIGSMDFEEVLTMILKDNQCYTQELLDTIVRKRIHTKEDCFKQLHPQILPMLTRLKEQGILIGLISNCFSEEAKVIRDSILFPYFDAVYLSYEQGIAKPDLKIYQRCMDELGVNAAECIYVGDGKSQELEAAETLGMTAIQAVWYLKNMTGESEWKKEEYIQLFYPLDLFKLF